MDAGVSDCRVEERRRCLVVGKAAPLVLMILGSERSRLSAVLAVSCSESGAQLIFSAVEIMAERYDDNRFGGPEPLEEHFANIP